MLCATLHLSCCFPDRLKHSCLPQRAMHFFHARDCAAHGQMLLAMPNKYASDTESHLSSISQRKLKVAVHTTVDHHIESQKFCEKSKQIIQLDNVIPGIFTTECYQVAWVWSKMNVILRRGLQDSRHLTPSFRRTVPFRNLWKMPPRDLLQRCWSCLCGAGPKVHTLRSNITYSKSKSQCRGR
jgi:hypothetical protein